MLPSSCRGRFLGVRNPLRRLLFFRSRPAGWMLNQLPDPDGFHGRLTLCPPSTRDDGPKRRYKHWERSRGVEVGVIELKSFSRVNFFFSIIHVIPLHPLNLQCSACDREAAFFFEPPRMLEKAWSIDCLIDPADIIFSPFWLASNFF